MSPYMHKPESVLENKTHKILWNFGIQRDHPILARRVNRVLNQVLINKKERTCHQVNFDVSADNSVKIQNEKKNKQILGSYQRTENVVEHEGDSDTHCSLRTWNCLPGPGKETWGLKIRGRIETS